MRLIPIILLLVTLTAAPAAAQTCTAPPAAAGRLTAKIDKAIPASGRTPFTPAVLTLSWRAANGAAVYQIEAGSESGRDDVGGTRVPATELSFTMPMADGTYYLRVRALNACGAGPASNEERVRVTGSVAPGAPNPLVILSTVHASRERLGSNAFVRVMGQVRNGWNAAPAAFVTVTASYEGSSGGGLGVTQSAYANGSGGRLRQTGAITDTVVAPGATGCFVLFTKRITLAIGLIAVSTPARYFIRVRPVWIFFLPPVVKVQYFLGTNGLTSGFFNTFFICKGQSAGPL